VDFEETRFKFRKDSQKRAAPIPDDSDEG